MDEDAVAGGRGDPLDRRIRALGVGETGLPCRRDGVNAHLDAMLRHYGLSPTRTRAGALLEMVVAETRCAVCPNASRCRRFLMGAAPDDVPAAFCPNADLLGELLFAELQRKVRPHATTP
jgi:hypothetical protein